MLSEELKHEAENKRLEFEIKTICQVLGTSPLKSWLDYLGNPFKSSNILSFTLGNLFVGYDAESQNARAYWGRITVFNTRHGETTAYLPGIWEAALNAVYLKAVAAKDKQEDN